MINRRHIRIKVLEACYGSYIAEQNDLDAQAKNLLRNIEKLKELYVILLDALVTLQKIAKERAEIRKLKFTATDADRNPNLNFIENPIIKKIADNEDFQSYKKSKKLNPWYLEKKYLQDILITLEQNESYQKYLSKKEVSFAVARDFVIDIYKNYIAPNEKLHSYFEEVEKTWVADIPFANSLIVKKLEKINADKQLKIPLVFQNKNDKEFALQLFKKTMLNHTHFEVKIAEQLKNWELSRVAELDMILLKMGICELLYFSEIPIKVTLNEYIELAKEYAGEKSYIFINGILNKLSKTMDINKL